MENTHYEKTMYGFQIFLHQNKHILTLFSMNSLWYPHVLSGNCTQTEVP